MMMIVVARGGGEECNNSRFLILPERSVPNLASKVPRLTLGRLATDWQSSTAIRRMIPKVAPNGQPPTAVASVRSPLHSEPTMIRIPIRRRY